MKTKPIESVLHDWVHLLPFQQQALLMTGMRGPDGCSKHNNAKVIVRYLRGAVLKPAGDWNGKNNNDFMWGEYIIPNGPYNTTDLFIEYSKGFWESHDEFPHHFIMHLIHCAEVVAYHHPVGDIRRSWNAFYLDGCKSFHMAPESYDEMNERLNDFGYSKTI